MNGFQPGSEQSPLWSRINCASTVRTPSTPILWAPARMAHGARLSAFLCWNFKLTFSSQKSLLHTYGWTDGQWPQICHSSGLTPWCQFSVADFTFYKNFSASKHLLVIGQTKDSHLFCDLSSQSHLTTSGLTPTLSCLSLAIGVS